MLLAFGSPHAHNVILLRAKGIPVVVGAGPTVLSIPDGTVVAVDGGRGEFVVDPPEEVREEFGARVTSLAQRQSRARERAAEPAITRDAITIPVGANVGSVDDARAAAAHGADNAGLVRTEFLFFGRQDAPDVEEQLAVYRKIAESLDGRRITLRTLDVGGDKPLEFLPAPAEMNPFLGVRGIRLSLAHPELMADQLLAMVLLAHQTPVSVMFPMISTLDELFTARGLFDEAISRTGRERPADLQVGMMVEVPAAALKAAAFARHVDFLSIGTNDLTQYAMAADRNNEAVAAIGDTLRPRPASADPHHLPGCCRAGVGVGVRRIRRRRTRRGAAARAGRRRIERDSPGQSPSPRRRSAPWTAATPAAWPMRCCRPRAQPRSGTGWLRPREQNCRAEPLRPQRRLCVSCAPVAYQIAQSKTPPSDISGPDEKRR